MPISQLCGFGVVAGLVRLVCADGRVVGASVEFVPRSAVMESRNILDELF